MPSSFVLKSYLLWPRFVFRNQKEVLINGLAGMLGNKPNVVVNIETIKTLTDNSCEVTITVAEKGVTGSLRKVGASELASFLNQPAQKQQLTNAGVYLTSAFATLSPEQLEDYLNNPPSGIYTILFCFRTIIFVC